MDNQRIEELINFQQLQRKSSEMTSRMFGNLPMVEAASHVTREMIDDTIEALRELQGLQSVRKMIDG